jgi:hypothetical protein
MRDPFSRVLGSGRGHSERPPDCYVHALMVAWHDLGPSFALGRHVTLTATLTVDMRGGRHHVALYVHEERDDGRIVDGPVHTWELAALYQRRRSLENTSGLTNLNPRPYPYGCAPTCSCQIPAAGARQLFAAMDTALRVPHLHHTPPGAFAPTVHL